jgi:hypothetical protein
MIILHPDHPYLKKFKPWVIHIQCKDGREIWSVRWRSFDTMKQDADFPTKAQADAFIATLPQRTTDIDEDCGPEEFAMADAFWRDL